MVEFTEQRYLVEYTHMVEFAEQRNLVACTHMVEYAEHRNPVECTHMVEYTEHPSLVECTHMLEYTEQDHDHDHDHKSLNPFRGGRGAALMKAAQAVSTSDGHGQGLGSWQSSSLSTQQCCPSISFSACPFLICCRDCLYQLD